nr:uncharacterized protein LOC111416527 [Onthophagus taurus]
MSPKNALWIYMTVIRPMLTNGAVVWWSKTLQSTSTAALNKVQRLACLYVTGALRTSAAMENVLNLTLYTLFVIHLFIQEVALVTMIRLRAAGILMGERDSKNAVLWKEMVRFSPILESKTDFTPLQHIFTKKYLTHTSSTEVEVKKSFKIYTDGSSRREGTGVFSYDLRPHVSEPLGKGDHRHTGEVNPLFIVRSSLEGKAFTIYTDSRQAILALSRITITSGLVMDCHLTLEKAAVLNCVILQWTKGDSTYSGNKHADRLAKRAAKRASCSPEPIITSFLSTQIEIIKDFTYKKFMNWWGKVKGCYLFKELLYYPSAEAALSFVKLGRNALRIVTGLVTGHCKVNKHLHNLKLAVNPLCRFCEESEETVRHILCDCPTLQDLRMRDFGEEWPSTDGIRNAFLRCILAFGNSLGWLI